MWESTVVTRTTAIAKAGVVEETKRLSALRAPNASQNRGEKEGTEARTNRVVNSNMEQTLWNIQCRDAQGVFF